MKKNIFAFLLICMLLVSCRTVFKPKSDQVGCISGKFEVLFVKSFLGLKPGLRDDGISIRIKNANNRKKYLTKTQDGYYNFINLPAGEYVFDSFFFKEKHLSSEIGLNGKFEKLKVEVKPHTFVTMNNIRAKVQPHKASFIMKGRFDYIFSVEDLDGIKKNFAEMDRKKLWEAFEWVRGKEKVEENIIQLTSDELITNYLTIYTKDQETVAKLMKIGEFYLALLKAHETVKNLMEAYYIKKADSTDIPEVKSILELSKKFDSGLSTDQKLLLVDLADFYGRSKEDVDAEEYKKIFTKQYVDTYLARINGINDWLVKTLKNKIDKY